MLSPVSLFCVLLQLDLASNELCGLNWEGKGTYTAEGIKALADAVAVNASLTSLDLRGNRLGDEGWCAVFDALRDHPQNKIKEWELSSQGINATIAKSLAAYVAVSASLTQVLAFCQHPLTHPSEHSLQRCIR